MRRYGKWAGNERGHPEDHGRCVVEVRDPSGWRRAQCTRRRGKGRGGLFCGQHARMDAEGKLSDWDIPTDTDTR